MNLAKAAIALAALAAGASLGAEPQLQSMCAEMASWTPKQLQGLKDPDLEKFTCISAKATLRAMNTQDRDAEKNCRAGSIKLIEEFKRRWPQREASEVTGKC